ncbi:MAG: extracellular solute-binding protein [Phycisphaerae bacterium]|nr:extracellular solute-binding protein [Phycisphaerae bacterium]
MCNLRRMFALLIVGLLSTVAGGCKQKESGNKSEPVVLYTSIDEAFARQIIDRLKEDVGLEVRMLTDAEAGKTTGLVKRLRAEADNPRADVFWSSELFHTILLAREGILEPYDSPAAADIPSRYRDPEHRWAAVGLRGRVLAFDPNRVLPEELPTHWEMLGEPRHASRLSIANPLFGTTGGHVAAMFALWGEERARNFLTRLHQSDTRIAAGNSSAVRDVIAGRAAICATDTDDVWVAQRQGASLDLRYLDMGDGGTLLIPTSVGIVAGCKHPGQARKLVDFLVSAELERRLARTDSRNIPVRPALRAELNLELPPETRVSFQEVADHMPVAAQAVREIVIR